VSIYNVSVVAAPTSLAFSFLESDRSGPYYPVAFTTLWATYVDANTVFTKTVGALGANTVTVPGLTARTQYGYYLANAKDAAGTQLHNTYSGPASPILTRTLANPSNVPPWYFIYGWRSMLWSNYGPLVNANMFTTFTVTGVTATSAQINCTLALDGVWSAAFGRQANGYLGRTLGRAVNGGQADAVLITGLLPNTQYFVDVIAQINDPNVKGIPQSGLYTAVALTFTTAQGVPLSLPLDNTLPLQLEMAA